jgi:hypothetical protein
LSLFHLRCERHRRKSLKKLLVSLGVAVAMLVPISMNLAYAGDNPHGDKITICHAAGLEGTTHYITLTIGYEAVYGPGGHFNENGTTQAGHEQDYLGACTTPTETPPPSPSCEDNGDCPTTPPPSPSCEENEDCPTSPPPVPCEQTDEGCPTTPPPPPPTYDAFIFSTCETGTFVRGIGSGILNITVNGVLTQYNPYDGSDIYLTVVNGDIITAGFNGGDTKTLTVNLDCEVIVVPPTEPPTPGEDPTWVPTWAPSGALAPGEAPAGDLALTGFTAGQLIPWLIGFVLLGLLALGLYWRKRETS